MKLFDNERTIEGIIASSIGHHFMVGGGGVTRGWNEELRGQNADSALEVKPPTSSLSIKKVMAYPRKIPPFRDANTPFSCIWYDHSY